jgi:hypothetical protein
VVNVAPTVGGVPIAGEVLSVTASGEWYGTAPLTRSYQWLHCDASGTNCAVISGATTPYYSPTDADVGSTIKVRETAQNASGTASSDSAATLPIQGGADDPVVPSTVSDTQDEVPTAISDPIDEALLNSGPTIETAANRAPVQEPNIVPNKCVADTDPPTKYNKLRVQASGFFKCSGPFIDYMEVRACVTERKRNTWVDLGCGAKKSLPGPGTLNANFISVPCVHDSQTNRFKTFLVGDAHATTPPQDRPPITVTFTPYVKAPNDINLYC